MDLLPMQIFPPQWSRGPVIRRYSLDILIKIQIFLPSGAAVKWSSDAVLSSGQQWHSGQR